MASFKLGGKSILLSRPSMKVAQTLSGIPVSSMSSPKMLRSSTKLYRKWFGGVNEVSKKVIKNDRFKTGGYGRLQTSSGIPIGRYPRSGALNSSLRSDAAQNQQKQMNKWIPTIVGAGIIGGGLVAYANSRKNGRRNNELFRP